MEHEPPSPKPPAASQATAAPTPAAELESEPASPKRRPAKRKASSGHGGARANAGVKPLGPSPRTTAAYIALTPAEKRELEARARKARLSVSSYMRKRLGFTDGG